MQKRQTEQSTAKNTASNFHSHTKAPTFSDQKCVYHALQSITSFCKCEECLLPVCNTCIKLHSEQHKLNKTSPDFEELTIILNEILGVYSKLGESINTIKKTLVNVEEMKRDSEVQIRKKLVEHRNRLVRQFEKSLKEMENRIVEQIVKDDQGFITALEEIDDELTKISRTVDRDRQILQSDDILKHIIIYYGKQNGPKFQRLVDELDRKTQSLMRSNIVVTVDDGELINLHEAVSRFMRIKISDRSSNGDSIE